MYAIGAQPDVGKPLQTVAETPAYLSKSGRFMSDEEREEVVAMLAADPMIGKIIKGTGGLRKARTALAGRGKRGGARVIYWFHSAAYPAVLLWAFAKNEADDLTAEQRKVLARESQRLLEDFGGSR
jgi:hypothetical protein